MKKTYIIPQMEIVKIGTQQMLAASGEVEMKDGSATEWGARGDEGLEW